MSLNDTAAPRLAIPALGGLYDALAPYSYPLIRFATSAILVPHGYGKLFHGGVTGLAGNLDKMGFHPGMIWAYWVGGSNSLAPSCWRSACLPGRWR